MRSRASKRAAHAIDKGGHYLTNTVYCLGTEDLYLLGVLNRKLFWFAIGNISIPFGTRAGQYRYWLIYQYMEKVPIRVIDFSNPADRLRHDRMVSLVEAMLACTSNWRWRRRATSRRRFRGRSTRPTAGSAGWYTSCTG